MVFSYFSRILDNVKRIDLQNKELKEWINMGTNDFNFYNSENDGYRGGFGDYTDPIPRGPRRTWWTGAAPEAPWLSYQGGCSSAGLRRGGRLEPGVGGARLYRQMDGGTP